MVSVSTVVSNLMELEGPSSEKFDLGSGDRGRQPDGHSVSDLGEGLGLRRYWVMGPEKAAYRSGCTCLPDPPGGAMREESRYHDHPTAPTLNGPRPATRSPATEPPLRQDPVLTPALCRHGGIPMASLRPAAPSEGHPDRGVPWVTQSIFFSASAAFWPSSWPSVPPGGSEPWPSST